MKRRSWRFHLVMWLKLSCSPNSRPPRRPLTGISFVSSLNYHHGCDDGDECVAEGQQSVGGLGAALALSVGRSDALHERGGGGCLAPRGFLLHLLLDVVLYDVAVVVSPHCGGAKGPQRTPSAPWIQPTGPDSCWRGAGKREVASRLFSCCQRSSTDEDSHYVLENGSWM